ncbi:hypothetical protein [Streptomyces sp. 35G-GA-8]|uniref:hypothetical protein n=1 Tax=Streptomyces sp. 35G-GA-8 TaxID=2939434 RepID=UPI00201F8512|nr:hypothetical protein [Streptomyces sp. 35G-GA-8]MCL7382225.1 hypothetical protein [Streptomyces sp. 35G-GA-8]
MRATPGNWHRDAHRAGGSAFPPLVIAPGSPDSTGLVILLVVTVVWALLAHLRTRNDGPSR